jgi:hypothetical protein
LGCFGAVGWQQAHAVARSESNARPPGPFVTKQAAGAPTAVFEASPDE